MLLVRPRAQFNIMETMYPTSFLEFRTALVPASGFQSRQFRVLENRLGLRSDLRFAYQRTIYKEFFSDEGVSAIIGLPSNLTHTPHTSRSHRVGKERIGAVAV